MLRLLLLFLVLCAAGFVVAVRYLPWWGIAIGGVVFIVAARYLGGYLIKQLFMAPFRAKGAVLRGAKAEVHSVTATTKPSRGEKKEEGEEAEEDHADEEEEEFKNAPYYAIDVSILPQNVKGPFRSYNPSEISLVEFGSVFKDDDSDSSLGQVVKVEVFHDGKYHSYDENAPESNRLRLTTRVKPGKRKLAFRYYFETFGEVSLPA